ncbi:MAG: segregation/condensation protein A [Clostridia bacterium]|nr:segregation/condensation protein A [Clostridia bacterium]
MEEMVEEIEPSSSLKFSFEGLEVPLDLILQVIDEKGLDIKTFKVADITDQYLKYVEEMEVLDMDEATAFLDMASRLLLIKSKSLLPVEEELIEEEEMSDEEKLRIQIQEYKLFKEAGATLQEQENVARLYKQPDKNVGDARIVFNQFNLDKLLDAFAFILMRTKDKENPQEKKISRDRWTVQDKIQFLTNILKDTEEINFFSLFDDTYSKMEIITVFMAILEMLKFQKIEVVQAERYADIKIKRKEISDES